MATHLAGGALGQLTETLCQFDRSGAAREPGLDVAGITCSVAHYAATLPSARELAG